MSKIDKSREKRKKLQKLPCISVISIRQRLRKCGFQTFKEGTTRKVVKMMKKCGNQFVFAQNVDEVYARPRALRSLDLAFSLDLV